MRILTVEVSNSMDRLRLCFATHLSSQPERGRLMDLVSLLNNILLLFHPRIEQPEKMKLSLTIEDDD